MGTVTTVLSPAHSPITMASLRQQTHYRGKTAIVVPITAGVATVEIPHVTIYWECISAVGL